MCFRYAPQVSTWLCVCVYVGVSLNGAQLLKTNEKSPSSVPRSLKSWSFPSANINITPFQPPPHIRFKMDVYTLVFLQDNESNYNYNYAALLFLASAACSAVYSE